MDELLFSEHHLMKRREPGCDIWSLSFSFSRLVKLQFSKTFQPIKMLKALYALPFTVLKVPNLKLKRPSWFHKPSTMTVFALILCSYFLVTGGLIYDVIVEPPSVGSTTDEHGHSKPVAIMPYRINGQYIMEGLASSFMYILGGLGFIIFDRTLDSLTAKRRIMLTSLGFIMVLLSFFACWIFMRIKLPGYLQS
ncbi:unnamed protein product [Notodromas monacha]|uniref:Oligosaccharyltransferase complex subunit n=1 Tax=Notodromas monacha TaxID=399045 RepID=A0A7R9BED2_9CRUS|nr:unnamed protein product [Notodromas monacha]CAG0913252.1 unnamed protein product [Notodromas monacha]